jgi:hypothetical protein
VVLALFIDPIVDRIDLSIKYDLVLAVIALCGLVVVCLPSDAGFAGSNLAEDNGFLMAIKIRSTTSFGGEVKPSAPCRKSLRCVKEPASMKDT